jgi:chromosome segregation ATPase
MKILFAQLPNTLEELDERITSLKAKADLNWSTNPKVIEDYEKRKSEIDALQTELHRQQHILHERHNEMEKLKESWLPELQRIVGVINNSFAHYMSAIGTDILFITLFLPSPFFNRSISLSLSLSPLRSLFTM